MDKDKNGQQGSTQDGNKIGGGPNSQGAGNTTGQQGSPHGGKEGKEGSAANDVGAGQTEDQGEDQGTQPNTGHSRQ